MEADAVTRAWSDILRKVRSRILAVPSRVRQAAAIPAETVEVMDRELRLALEELGHGDD